MRAINHALTGALLGLSIGEPLIAVPASVVSHYFCDVIPHYGTDRPNIDELRSKRFRNLLYIDAFLCAALVGLLGISRPKHWLLAAVCAFAAAAPDFWSINYFLSAVRGTVWKPDLLFRFAKNIQWFEHPIGAVVEVAWFSGANLLLATYLH